MRYLDVSKKVIYTPTKIFLMVGKDGDDLDGVTFQVKTGGQQEENRRGERRASLKMFIIS